MSFEMSLETQLAWALERMLEPMGILEPTSGVELAALEKQGWAHVPVLPSHSNAKVPGRNLLAVHVEDVEERDRKACSWTGEVQVLVRTHAADDLGGESSRQLGALEAAKVHGARCKAIQKLFFADGSKTSNGRDLPAELMALANGEVAEGDGPGYEQWLEKLGGGIDRCVLLDCFEFSDVVALVNEDSRDWILSVKTEYRWNG